MPEGCGDGDIFEVDLDGVLFEVTVPNGKKAHDVLELEVPAESLAGHAGSKPAEDSVAGSGGQENSLPEGELMAEAAGDPKDHKHVTFTDAEPAVVLFRPEVGGLHGPGQLTSDELRQCEQVELLVPPGCRPGDVLTVNRGNLDHDASDNVAGWLFLGKREYTT